MAKTQNQEDQEEPFITEDSPLTGLFIAKDHKVIPQLNEQHRVHYLVYGDVRKSLEEIYKNSPVGSLDVLNGIKSARAMIFTLKGKRG